MEKSIKYYVFTKFSAYEFSSYRDAEIFCGVNGIPCEEIYENENN